MDALSQNKWHNREGTVKTLDSSDIFEFQSMKMNYSMTKMKLDGSKESLDCSSGRSNGYLFKDGKIVGL